MIEAAAEVNLQRNQGIEERLAETDGFMTEKRGAEVHPKTAEIDLVPRTGMGKAD